MFVFLLTSSSKNNMENLRNTRRGREREREWCFLHLIFRFIDWLSVAPTWFEAKHE